MLAALPSAGTMLPLGFRLDEDAVVLEGTAHTAACPMLPAVLPAGATRLTASETDLAPFCPRARLRPAVRDAS